MKLCCREPSYPSPAGASDRKSKMTVKLDQIQGLSESLLEAPLESDLRALNWTLLISTDISKIRRGARKTSIKNNYIEIYNVLSDGLVY